MAYMSLHSVHITQGVAGENIQEGSAITLTVSGIHADVPVAMLASADATNIFVAIAPPDEFPRPTPIGMFQRPETRGVLDPRNATEPYAQPYTELRIGPSQMSNPTLLSGWMVQCHRGGGYAVPSGLFDTVPDQYDQVKVAANGRWTKDAAGTNAVGECREVRGSTVYLVLYR